MSDPLPDPAPLLAALRATLVRALDTLGRESGAARAGAQTDGAERAENRGERAAISAAGYLEGALAARRSAIEADIAAIDRLAPGPRDVAAAGAIVCFEPEDGAPRLVLLAPGAPGAPLAGWPEVLVVTPASPLGAALHGRRAGDTASFARGGRSSDLVVLAVR